ncbi:MAG: hypothetical protein M1830_000201 [Pleopsidium flavum]|nr:MAG: hypothetical protein M1830_000201 [Pleopsidium flavum]
MPHANAEAFSKAKSLGVLRNRNTRRKIGKRSSQTSRTPAAETIIEAPDVKQLRRARTVFYGNLQDQPRRSSSRKMAHIIESRAGQAGPREASRKSSAGTGHDTHNKQHGRHRRRRRKVNETQDGSTVYVYRYAGDGGPGGDGERPKATAELRSLSSTTDLPTRHERRSMKSDLRALGRHDRPRRRHTSLDNVAHKRSIHHEVPGAVPRKTHERVLGRSTTRKRHSEQATEPLDRPRVVRSSSMREKPSPPARPSLYRSSTTVRTKTTLFPDIQPGTPSIRSKTEHMSTGTKESGRGPRVVYSLFGIPSVVPSEQR